MVNKFRISMSEGSREDLISMETHSLCTDDITNRLVTLIAPSIKAHQTSIDVGGATSTAPHPPWKTAAAWSTRRSRPGCRDFGPYHERNPDGSRNLLLITGNMPDRCDGGRIWQRHNDKFLIRYGFRLRPSRTDGSGCSPTAWAPFFYTIMWTTPASPLPLRPFAPTSTEHGRRRSIPRLSPSP